MPILAPGLWFWTNKHIFEVNFGLFIQEKEAIYYICLPMTNKNNNSHMPALIATFT